MFYSLSFLNIEERREISNFLGICLSSEYLNSGTTKIDYDRLSVFLRNLFGGLPLPLHLGFACDFFQLEYVFISY